MSETAERAVGRAMRSSVVVRFLQRVAAGSAACAAVAAGRRGLRRARARIVEGLGGEWSRERELRTTERLEALFANSWVVAALLSLLGAPSAAPREARAKRLLNPVLTLDLPSRVRTVGFVVVVAVLTHTLLVAALGVPVAALGVPVAALGWGIRAGLVAAGLIVVWRPEAPAAAWRDRTAK